MKIQPLSFFEWLLHNTDKATYNLASSNIQGVLYEEFQQLTGFSLLKTFDLDQGYPRGAPLLKEVLCSLYHCTPEHIVTTIGASEANYLVLSSLLQPGDEVLVEQPGYQPMQQIPELLGAQCRPWYRRYDDNYQLDLPSLKQLLNHKTKCIVLTNLHNPSGVAANHADIETVADLAQRHNMFVLIDEIFLDGSLIKQPTSFGLPNTIVTSGMTKIYGLGGLHCGWILAPETIAETCQNLKMHSTVVTPYLSEIMSALALQKARHALIQRFQKIATTNMALLKQWIHGNDDLVEWVEPHGGIICFPKYRLSISSMALCQQVLDKYKVLIDPGSFFGEEGHVRISCGCAPPIFQEALQVLTKGLREIYASH